VRAARTSVWAEEEEEEEEVVAEQQMESEEGAPCFWARWDLLCIFDVENARKQSANMISDFGEKFRATVST